MATTPTPLVPPGTPAVILPAYSTPVFTEATVAMGAAVTSVVIEGATPNSPFTIGHPFKEGELAPTDTLVGRMAGILDIPLQMDVKATHKDGSIRHAIISGVVSQDGEMALIRSPLTEAPDHQVRAKGVEVVINEGGVEWRAQAFNSVGYLQGPIAVELIGTEKLVNAEGVEHPFLTVSVAERVYSTGHAKFDVVVEHTKAYATNGFIYPAPTATVPTPAPIPAQTDITYDVSIISDGEIVYSKTSLVHFPCTRWKKTFWQGGTPSVHVKHNTAYLIATKAVPNYDQTVVVPESRLAEYEKYLTTFQFGPMDNGRFAMDFSAPGGRGEIGIAPDIYAATVLSMDKRAYKLMLASASIGGSWSAHHRVDGEMLDITKYPYATISGNKGDTLNPATGKYEKLPLTRTVSKLKHDSAHEPAFGYIPYLLTGDHYYFEEMLFWVNFNVYHSNPFYRMFEKGWVKSDQLRGQGWSLSKLAEAAWITPDSYVQKQSLQYWIDCNMEYYRQNFTDAVAGSVAKVERRVTTLDPNLYNELGLAITGPALAYTVNGQPKVGVSLFMDDFFTQGVGRMFELGNEEAGRLLRWKGKFQVGRLLDPGYCAADATIYSLKVRDYDAATLKYSALYTSLKQCRDNTKPADQLACPTIFELNGYPTSTEGFPSNYQPALAACVDAGYPEGSKAWELFMSRSLKPNYGISPQFAIVPRSLTKVDPPVVVEPPVTPPPPVEPPPVVVEPPPVVVPPVEPPKDPVTPPVEPPVEPPPVVVEPPVEPDAKIVINNSCLVGLMDATVLVHNGVHTKAYINQSSVGSDITIIDKKFLVKGVKYTAIVLDDTGIQIAKIYPIQAV